MLSPKLIVALAMTGLLGVAAFNPSETYRLVTNKTVHEAVDHFEAAKDKQVKYWAEVATKADSGDPESLFLMANRALHRWQAHGDALIPPDSVEAERLFREAAARGHVKSVVAVWKIEGSDPNQLIEIANSALENEAPIDALGEVSFHLIYQGIESCQADLLEMAERVHSAVQSHGGEDLFAEITARMRAEVPSKCAPTAG